MKGYEKGVEGYGKEETPEHTYYAAETPESEEKSLGAFEDLFANIPVSGSIFSSPCIYDNTLFFGSCDKNFYAIDADTGRLKWKFTAGDIIMSSAVACNGAVYFGSYDNNLYALDAKNGEIKWKYRTGDKIFDSPVIAEDRIYFGSADKSFYCLDAATGRVLWKFITGQPIISEIGIVSNMVIFSSFDGHVYALHRENGSLLWKVRLPGLSGFQGFCIVDEKGAIVSDMHTRHHEKIQEIKGGSIYFVCEDNNIYCLDLNGGIKWKYLTGGIGGVPIANKGVIYVGTEDTYFYALSEKGEMQWKIKTGGHIVCCAFIHDDAVYFGSFDKCLYAAGMDGAVRWKFVTGGMISSSPYVHNNRLYVASTDTFFYCIDIKTKDILWKFKTGFPAKFEETGKGKEIMNSLVDYKRKIFKVWKPETMAGKMAESPAKSAYHGDSPSTIYGASSPYSMKKGRGKGARYG